MEFGSTAAIAVGGFGLVVVVMMEFHICLLLLLFVGESREYFTKGNRSGWRMMFQLYPDP